MNNSTFTQTIQKGILVYTPDKADPGIRQHLKCVERRTHKRNHGFKQNLEMISPKPIPTKSAVRSSFLPYLSTIFAGLI